MSICFKPGRKTFVHVNMMVFKRNRKQGTNVPAITAKGGVENYYGYEARIQGPAYIEYSGNGKPLVSCGARVAITSRFPVEVLESFQDRPVEGKRQLFISGRTIRSNKLKNELEPVISLSKDGNIVSGYGAMIEGDVIVRQTQTDGGPSLIIETDAKVIIDPNPPEQIIPEQAMA